MESLDRQTDVAVFLPDLAGGGAQRGAVALCNELASRGWQVDLVRLNKGGPFFDQISASVFIVTLSHARLSRTLLELVKYLRNRRPRTFVSFLRHNNIAAAVASRFARYRGRLVLSERNAVTENKRVPSFWLARLLYSSADLVTAVSKDVRQDVIEFFNVKPGKVEVLFNPHDLDRIREKSLEPCPHPWLKQGEIPVILAVGRLVVQKDYPTLLRAFRYVLERKHCRLLILGTGPLLDNLRTEIFNLGLEGSVELAGFASNPYAYMSRSSVLVMSSIYEGLPVVAVEAAYLGKTLACTRFRGGLTELHEIGLPIHTSPVGNAEELSKAILNAMNNQSPADKKLIEQYFSTAAATSRWESALGLRRRSE